MGVKHAFADSTPPVPIVSGTDPASLADSAWGQTLLYPDRGQTPLHWGQTLGRKVVLPLYKGNVTFTCGWSLSAFSISYPTQQGTPAQTSTP